MDGGWGFGHGVVYLSEQTHHGPVDTDGTVMISRALNCTSELHGKPLISICLSIAGPRNCFVSPTPSTVAKQLCHVYKLVQQASHLGFQPTPSACPHPSMVPSGDANRPMHLLCLDSGTEQMGLLLQAYSVLGERRLHRLAHCCQALRCAIAPGGLLLPKHQ